MQVFQEGMVYDMVSLIFVVFFKTLQSLSKISFFQSNPML